MYMLQIENVDAENKKLDRNAHRSVVCYETLDYKLRLYKSKPPLSMN